MTAIQLYAGPDLDSAVERTQLPSWLRERSEPSPLRLPATLESLLLDVMNKPTTRLRPTAAMVTGRERTSGATMRILFQGQLRSVDFCAEQILGSADFEVAPLSRQTQPACDVAVTDHPLLDRGLSGRKPALQVPQWLRQQRDLGGSWRQTVASIPTPLRKRIARMLGKNSFTASLRPAEAAAGDFYERIYLPYVKHRFGSAAIVTGERAFMREARNAWLLELGLEGQRLGASLLRPQGDTLHLGRSALSLHNALSHAFDLLDYFCFLTAQLAGCRCLDFGLSRPHIEDGTFANKVKWRPRLAPAGRFKPSIRIRPVSRSSATHGFLARNGFIEYRAGAFVVRRFYAEHMPSTEEAADLGRLGARSGLDAMTLAFCAAGDPPRAVSDVAPYPQLRRLTEATDPLRSFLLHA